ncbi:MAG: hypothetical protein ACFFAO_18430, partial [Candidatus Hermodarchaeota archaeon]
MPIGLIFMQYNDLSGIEILANYPKDVMITEKDLMQIFNTHDFSGEKGVISIMVGVLHVISYYTGPASHYDLILLLEVDDDPDIYEEAVIYISQIILQNLNEKKYLNLIPNLFQMICSFPTFTPEQRLAFIYQDHIKLSILNRLRSEGIIVQTQLINWLKEKYPDKYIDFESILFELVSKDIISIQSIKTEKAILIFFLKDIIILRVPPFYLMENPSGYGLPNEFIENYRVTISNYFENYKPF